MPRGAGARPLPRYPSINRPDSAGVGAPPSSGASVTGSGSLSGRPSSQQHQQGQGPGSVLTTNSFGSRRSKSFFGSPAGKISADKTYTLKLQSIRAEQLNYVTFPLCPVLKFRVDKQESATSKNLYSRAVATFPESFEFEVNVLKYKAGLDLEVEAVNVSPLSGELVPIGEGRVDLQSAMAQLNAQKILTIELLNKANQPSGLVLIGAILLDRPVGPSVSYPSMLSTNTGSGNGARTPFSPASSNKAALLDFNPKKGSGLKNAVLRVDHITCQDLQPPRASTPAMGSSYNSSYYGAPTGGVEYAVVVQVGNDSLRSEPPVAGKPKNNKVYTAHDCPMIAFDVDYDELPSETIHVAVFEVPAAASSSSSSAPSAKPTSNCIGQAQAPLYSLIGRNDGMYTPASEFAMQLKDEGGAPAGTVSLFLLFSKNNSNGGGGLQVDTARALFDSPMKGAAGSRSPTKHLRSLGMSPRLNNIRVPPTFHTGWIRISSIVATNLNKFRLVGNTARYKHLRDAPMTPVPAYLKHSELLGKQDPFLVVEAGEFWGSYSKVLLNQAWNCQWDQAAFCCYLSNLEASEQDLKITVFDRSCSGYHNVFIGFASVPLVNFFAPQRTSESHLELSVVDRRGKINGRLELKYTWEASDEKERWEHGIITKVCGDGCYDIRYDDGDEEFAVSKDVIRLLSRAGSSVLSASKRPGGFDGGLFYIQEGSNIEVNDRGRGMWFPARVVRNNGDDTYDLESSYEIAKYGVSADLVRMADEDMSPQRSSHNSSFGKKLNFEGSVVSNTNGRRSKFKLRDTVEGNFKSKGTWYVGKIFKVHYYDQYCTYDIDYLTGEFESEVAEDKIRVESSRSAPENAASAYDLRQLRAQRPESKVVVNPLHRTGAFAGLNSAAAGRSGADSQSQQQQRTKSKYQAGERVEVNYRGHGKYYPAMVEVDYESGLYDVLYDTEERDIDVAEDLIRSPDQHPGSSEDSPLQNDRQTVLSGLYKYEVGDRVEANFREIGKFIPGIITRDRGHGVFDIQYYDGRTESKVNFELIRLADQTSFFSPGKRSKYSVGQSVDSNCEGLGVWYHALIRNVLPDDTYNIQYDDGETEYDVSGDMLRPGGAYSPGIPSLKPFFRVGDRVKVACRSSEVEHEMRSLSAMKQRIMEERKKLAESKLAVAKRSAMIDASKAAAQGAHRGLDGFKDRVGYGGDLTCCQAEGKERESEGNSPTFLTGVSAGSFRKLDEIESAFIDPLDTSSNDEKAVETLNDAVTKAIVVEQSLGNLAGAAKDEEIVKAQNAFQLSVLEKEKADELALSRAMDEAKARKRNNFSKAEELKAFHEAYQKAEQELGHIMAARQLVLEQDEALKIAKQKADLEAKSIAGAQRKGEKATARLREEDRARLASGHFAQKDTRPRHHEHHGKSKESSSERVQKFLGPEVARDRDALRLALLRVKQADEELSAAKARAEEAGREYAAADAAAQGTAKDLQAVVDSNLKAEQTLTEKSQRSSEYAEYRKAAEAVKSYSTQARNKGNLKLANIHKAEVATQARLKKEEAAAVAGEKRTFAEESMIRAARNGDLDTAKSAMREANLHGVHQGDEVIQATAASKSETTELVAAKHFAEEEKKMYSTAKEIAVLAAGLLRVIIADQREREYRALEEAKTTAHGLITEVDGLLKLIAERESKRVITTEALQTETLAIEHIKARLVEFHRTETHISTMEKTTISLKALKAHNGRCDAELEMRGYSKDRAAFEERAKLAAKKCAIEESVAQTCAFDDVERDETAEKFSSPAKREVLHHFSAYSAEECKAVRLATAHAEEQCNALDEVKTLALMEIEAVDSCRKFAEDEFSALSQLASLERNELHALVDSQTVPAFQRELAECKSRAIDANRGFYLANQRAAEKRKELEAAKESTLEVLDALAKAQNITQHVTSKDFGIDRNKVSAVEGAQHASKAALTKAVVAEKARLTSEATSEHAEGDATEASVRAAASDRLRHREEESAHQAALASSEGISMQQDDSELQISLIAAITHCNAQLGALNDATNAVEREIVGLIDATAHAVQERLALMLALSKEETILLLKSQRDQQKADAKLVIAKRLLDGRLALMNDAQNLLERETLALDVAMINLERAAMQLVKRGDDDIVQFRAYQKEFKRLQCKKQKAAEAHKRRDTVGAKGQVARQAREAEENGALAMEEKVYDCEQAAVFADQKLDNEAQVRALREARKFCDECAAALEAAKEYAAVEEELGVEAQHECEEERKALSAARDHADECYRLLAKALSVLPLQHNTPMGLQLLNGGAPFFKGVPVRPRKRGPASYTEEVTVDPSKLKPAHSAFDNVTGNAALRAADFKDDDSIPDRDSKELIFHFDANPRKSALRNAQEDVERALQFLDAAKGRTEDAEKRYRAANSAATLEGKAVGEVEERNAATSRRLYDNFVGVEPEFAQLQKVRSDLNLEDKSVANLRAAKESEVKNVTPHAQNRQIFENAARDAAVHRAAAEEEAREAHKVKDKARLDDALVEAKNYCDMQATALNEAAQAAAKECSVWTNGTAAANKELSSAERAHDLADEEARLLALIRAAQLNQGKEAFEAAKRQAGAAKDNYETTSRGMDGFSDLIGELGATNEEREAELSDETKGTPMYHGYKEVRARFDAERKRAQAAHVLHDQEVAKALAAGKLKEQSEAEALAMEDKRLQAESAVDAAGLQGDKAAEALLTDEAKKYESGVSAAYGDGTESGLAEAAAWRAAVQHLETEKEALTAAHAESLDATGLLVQMRGEQIQRELVSLNDAKQMAVDCANGYEAANRRALAAAAALERSRAMLNSRSASLAEEITSIPAYNEYLDLVDALVSVDDQANHFMEEKLAERAEVDLLIAAKEQDEQAAVAAGTQRAAAERAMRNAQNRDDTEGEARAIQDLKNFSDDQEKALLSARDNAIEEASKWGVATDLANEEAQSRIVAKDHANAALNLLNKLKLDQEKQELEAKKVLTTDAEAAYRAVRKQVAEAKAKTAALVEKCKMVPGSVSEELLDTPEYDKYQHRLSTVLSDANRPVVDHDVINASEIARAKALGESRKREEVAADATAEKRVPVERSAVDLQRRGDLEKESNTVVDVNALVEDEEKSLLTAKQYSQDERAIWLNLKNLSDNELKAALGLNERAEDATRLLSELMLSEKGRLAEATVAAIDQAVFAQNHYVVMNKKTLARNATLNITTGKSDAFAKSLSELCKASPEFHTYEVLLTRNTELAAQAKAIKAEKDALVLNAEAVKKRRIALEEIKSSNAAKGALTRGSSVRELAAKFNKSDNKNSRTAQLSEAETEALTSLYNTALEENAAWESATECTIREKAAYSLSNTLFEQTLLALAAAKSNQRERDIAIKLAAAEDAAHSAEALFHEACAQVEQKEAELATFLARNEDLEAEVIAHDSSAQSSVALLRAKERVVKEQARAAAARTTRETVVVQATALADSRVCEVSAAEASAQKLRRVLVCDALSTSDASVCDEVLTKQCPSALTRIDMSVCEINSKGKNTSTDDVHDPAAPSDVTNIVSGDVVTWVSVRAVFPDFGVGKRQNLSVDRNMQELASEQVCALAEEASLEKATHHAIDEELTWRLALQHAQAEAEALANACAKADETARVLAGLKDDIYNQHKALLDAACADAEEEAGRFDVADADCSRLAQIYADKKAEIGDKDSALALECKNSPEYADFEHIMTQLKDSDEPAIAAARLSKGASVARAQQFGAKKRLAIEDAEAAAKAGLEADVKSARTTAFDLANQETSEWDQAQHRAADEGDALSTGISHEDQALGLLDKMKAEHELGQLGAAEAQAAGSKGHYDAAFALAARKQAEFEAECSRMNAKEAELMPESRGTPTYKNFYKLRTELLDEDEPFIISKRTAKVAAAQRADALVIANKRQKVTMESIAGEKAAWDEAGSLAMEEVGALDGGIDKAKRAQELLAQAQIEELNRLSNQEEVDLQEANRRALEAAAELEAMNRKIFAKREHLSTMKDESEELAARVAKKGPEFSGDVAAHRKTMLSVDQAVTAANVYKAQKDSEAAKAVAESLAAQRLLEAQPPVDDNSHEAAALRRSSLLDAKAHAVTELQHYTAAKSQAESELAELSRAEQVAKTGQDSLEEAGTTRSYRSRLGYLLLGGEEGLINIPKRRPFDTVKEQQKVARPIDFSRMQKAGKHSDFEPLPSRQRAMVCKEGTPDDFSDDSRDSKVLFELGGGWPSVLQHQLKRIAPYQPAQAEEYMPHISVPKEVTASTGNGRKGRARKQERSVFHHAAGEDGQEPERLRGKALFIAAVKHVVTMGRVVRTLKPLAEGELDVLKERITVSEDAAMSSSQFLVDTAVLQSRAGKALLAEDRGLDESAGSGKQNGSGKFSDKDESSEHVERASGQISSNIESFLQSLSHKDAMLTEYNESSSSKANSTEIITTTPTAAVNGKLQLKSLVNKISTAQKMAAQSRIPKTAGAEPTNFKPAKSVEDSHILSFLFGGLASSSAVDEAVFEDGEDVVETVKETTTNVTRTEEHSQRQTVEETHTEETDTVEVTSVLSGGASQPRIAAAPAPSSSASSAPKTAPAPSPASFVKSNQSPRSMKGSASQDSTERDDFGTSYDGGFDGGFDSSAADEKDKEEEEEERDTFSDLPSKPSAASPVISTGSNGNGNGSHGDGGGISEGREGKESRSGKFSKTSSSSDKEKGMKKVSSSSSITSGGSRGSSKKRSGGSSKSSKAESALMNEMMSGNLDF